MIRDHAIEIWKAGVAAVHGKSLVESALRIVDGILYVNDHSFDLSEFDRVLVVGGGKFSHYMAAGVESVFRLALAEEKQLSGFVTVPDGSNDQVDLDFIDSKECRPAGVNLPTERVLAATDEMLELLRKANGRTLVLALISGGGSALLESSDLPLTDIIGATNWLSSRGANIVELNTVRIAMSNVKGGGLCRAMPDGTLVGLIVSDVPNDDLRFVSSGPTVEYGSDVFANAGDVLDRFAATKDSGFPASVIKFLVDRHSPVSSSTNVTNVLIGDASVARHAAIEKARSLGYEIEEDCLAETNTCDQIADAVCRWLLAGDSNSRCVVSLGEPVVEPGDDSGQGGRNQHAVLSVLGKLMDQRAMSQFCFLSGGTDGEDGNTPVAGALVTDAELERLTTQSEQIADHLNRFDSHPFLKENGMVFEFGPTATNVADLRVLLRSDRHSG